MKFLKTTIACHHPDVIRLLAFSPNGELLCGASRSFSAEQKAVVVVWQMPSGNELSKIELVDIDDVAFSPDSKTLATGGGIRLWDAVNGSFVRGVTVTEKRTEWSTSAVAFSPSHSILAVGSETGTVFLLDSTNYRVLSTLVSDVLKYEVKRLQFFSSGSLLCVLYGNVTGEACLCLWDLERCVIVARLDIETCEEPTFALSPDNQLVATQGPGAQISVWNARTLKLDSRLAGHSDEVDSLNFSFDSRYLFSVSVDLTGRVWNTAQMKCVAVRDDFFSPLVASPNGPSLAIAVGSEIEIWRWID